MKHQEFIDEIFSNLYEWWMDDNDKQEFKRELLRAIDTDEQELSDSVDVGIRNGYSLEVQRNMILRDLFSQTNK